MSSLRLQLSLLLSIQFANRFSEGNFGSIYKAKFPDGQVLLELNLHLQASFISNIIFIIIITIIVL